MSKKRPNNVKQTSKTCLENVPEHVWEHVREHVLEHVPDMFQNMFRNMFQNMFQKCMYHTREVGFAGGAGAARPRSAGGAGAARFRIAGGGGQHAPVLQGGLGAARTPISKLKSNFGDQIIGTKFWHLFLNIIIFYLVAKR